MMETSARLPLPEEPVFAKVTRKLIPLLFLGYVIAFLNRTNVGFAKLQMAGDLDLSDAAYGFGAGIFFLGYLLFEVPSNFVMRKVGARRWIARIMLSWGLLAAGFAFSIWVSWGSIATLLGVSSGELSFFIFRFLLGVAEAGFYPGVILYLTYWYPAQRRAQAVALFVIAVPLTSVIGGPLNGAIMQFMDGLQGLRGWQWLFLAEGIPALLLGLVILLKLPDRPDSARWLTRDERELIHARLDMTEDRTVTNGRHVRFSMALRDPRVWILSAAYLCASMGGYAATFWGPTLVQESLSDGEDLLSIGLYLMLPYIASAAVIVAWAKHADRTNERRWHATIAALLEAVGLVLLATGRHIPILALIGLALVSMGVLSWLAIFWSFPTSFLAGAAAAGGIALINSLGNLGGYFGPSLVGAIRDLNGDASSSAFWILAGLAVTAAILTNRVALRCDTNSCADRRVATQGAARDDYGQSLL